MRTAWSYLSVAAVFSTLGLCGCGADAQYRPGQTTGNPDAAGSGGGGEGGSGGASGDAGSGSGSGGDAGGGGTGTAAKGQDPRPKWDGTKQSDWIQDGGPPSFGPPTNDTCMGEPVSLAPGFTLNIDGTLTEAVDDLTTFCADTLEDPGNPDVVYQLDVSADISLSVQLNTAAFDPALSLRLTTCTSESNGDTCLDFGPSSEHAQVSLAAGTYWLVVDSADGNTGDFTLDLIATEPACGDGVLNPGEQCDPGGPATDDGCVDPLEISECTFGEAPDDSDVTACPGFGPVSIDISADPQNPTVTILGPHNNGSGGSSQQNDLTLDPDVCGWAAAGPENVYHVVPTSSGTLHVRIGYDGASTAICDINPNCGDFILYARSGTCEPADPVDPAQQLACVDFDPGNQEILSMEFAVTANADYWVFVDGLDSTWGIGQYYLEMWEL